MTEFLCCEQAATLAMCSVYKIREAIKLGELKAYRPGKVYIIDPADLDRWVRSNAIKVRKRPEKSAGG